MSRCPAEPAEGDTEQPAVELAIFILKALWSNGSMTVPYLGTEPANSCIICLKFKWQVLKRLVMDVHRNHIEYVKLK